MKNNLRVVVLSQLMVGLVSLAAFGGILAVAIVPTLDDVTYEPTEREVSARILGADEHLRGSGSFRGGGSFLGWGASGTANLSGDAGRLSVVVPLGGQERHLDLEITRSRYLALSEERASNISLTVEYLPCKVDEVDDLRMCYRLRSAETDSLMETSADFQSHAFRLKTDSDAEPKHYMAGWWEDGVTGYLAFSGYLPREASERMLTKERESMDF